MSFTMDELARAVQLGGKNFLEWASWNNIFAMSYEAGGVHPTLVVYALGSIATLFFLHGGSWTFRLAPMAICLVLFMHTLHNLERKSFEWLLMVAMVTGVCCTYVQLASLDLVLEYFAFNKTSKNKNKKKKLQ
ncbi:hypothetical protein BBP00_00002254 [Phytophthora kernoviae]|uniref:Uncharacterized protein n=1 Tax=Phytophthora kernoviae TaxID=325452 RepID=A0A3F2RXV4_9STRA|nr:hypothetical protein BBP00_00002254 [Phytophthora kernoviae]